MKSNMRYLVAALVFGACLFYGATASAEDSPPVAGVMGMTPVTETSCAAAWVPVGKNQALAGLVWYNNDGSVIFPEVLVASGTQDAPVSLASCSIVAENVTGASSAWSTVTFDAPLASRNGGFYVLLRFPEGSEQTAVGSGGGAGIGYVENGGIPGWLSVDGEDWVKVGRSYGFAIVPEYVPAESWMVEKTGRMYEPPEKDQSPGAKTYETAMQNAAPNPFNPATTIWFTLKEEAKVKMQVFDVRGHKVASLTSETFNAGEHAVSWDGRDTNGKRVSSGAYFVQMKTSGSEFSQRVMLVK